MKWKEKPYSLLRLLQCQHICLYTLHDCLYEMKRIIERIFLECDDDDDDDYELHCCCRIGELEENIKKPRSIIMFENNVKSVALQRWWQGKSASQQTGT